MKKPTITTKQHKIQQSSRMIFIAIMFASVVVAFSLVSLKFMYEQWRFNEALHAEKEAVRDQLKDNIENAQALKRSFTQLEAAAPLISSQDKQNSSVILDALPSKYDYPALATSIEKLTKLSGVGMESFDGKDEELGAVDSSTTPAPIEIEFSVSVTGQYKDIQKFMKNIEKSIRPLDVTGMKLMGEEENMKASFDMVTYYQPTIDLGVTTKRFEQ